MEARWRCRIMGMSEKFSSEDSGRQKWWRRCRTTGMDTTAEDMREGNRRYVGRWRWRNGLEERQQTGQILTGNN